MLLAGTRTSATGTGGTSTAGPLTAAAVAVRGDSTPFCASASPARRNLASAFSIRLMNSPKLRSRHDQAVSGLTQHDGNTKCHHQAAGGQRNPPQVATEGAPLALRKRRADLPQDRYAHRLERLGGGDDRVQIVQPITKPETGGQRDEENQQ